MKRLTPLILLLLFSCQPQYKLIEQMVVVHKTDKGYRFEPDGEKKLAEFEDSSRIKRVQFKRWNQKSIHTNGNKN